MHSVARKSRQRMYLPDTYADDICKSLDSASCTVPGCDYDFVRIASESPGSIPEVSKMRQQRPMAMQSIAGIPAASPLQFLPS